MDKNKEVDKDKSNLQEAKFAFSILKGAAIRFIICIIWVYGIFHFREHTYNILHLVDATRYMWLYYVINVATMFKFTTDFINFTTIRIAFKMTLKQIKEIMTEAVEEIEKQL